MDKEGSGAGKMAIPLTQRSICPNLCFFFSCATGGIDDDIYIFPQNYLLCHLKTPIWNWQLLTKTPLTNTPFRHAKSPKASFFLLNKKCRDFPHGLTPWDPFFWARSDRAAVAINEPENRAGWWRIEEEIEVKRSRSQDLERGRGCDQFFDSESRPRGWYKKRLKLTRFFRIKKSLLAAQEELFWKWKVLDKLLDFPIPCSFNFCWV